MANCRSFVLFGWTAENSLRITRLEIVPRAANLRGPEATQRFLATAYLEDGHAIDVTRQAIWEVEGPAVIATDVAGMVRPTIDGESAVVARIGSLTATAQVNVSQAKVPQPISFENEILPILTKSGCNTAGCHGKASGQNGFKLSIFGFDTQLDYEALLKEGRGRRVFPSAPEKSLILHKATGGVPHGGGVRFATDSFSFRVLKQWIEQGAPYGGKTDSKVVGLEIWPTEREMHSAERLQLLVTAHYSDGSKRDVTSMAEYSSNVEPIAGVDETGWIRVTDVPGEAAVMARYMGEVAVTRILRPHGKLDRFPRPPSNNFVDELVWDKLEKLAILPSELCTDYEFLRRVFIDAIGTLPTVEETREFLRDGSPQKRQKLVDRLLERHEFADYWALKWGDILRVDSAAIAQKGAYVFHQWLRDVVARNLPYDEMVRQILTAHGDSNLLGPANLYRAVKGPEELANTVSQVFLGVRIECAQCHHHPYERWGQDDFFGLAAYFTQIKRKTGSRGQELILVSGSGDIKHPRTKAVVPPKPLGGLPKLTTADQPLVDRRAELADWVTAPNNPFLARMAANRIWAHFLGRGLVEPVDDMRSTNPASNEPLLDALAKHLVEHKFDMRELLRVVLNSRVYQLSARTNASNELDSQNFSHAAVKSIPAEVLLDAMSQATEVPEKFDRMPLGTRAIQLWDNRLPSYFLATFGKPVRASVCECERSAEPSMTQALHLLNAPEIERKVSSPYGRVRRLVQQIPDNRALVEELYLTTLSRFPSEIELANTSIILDKAMQRQIAAEDILWALMNSKEFIFNH